jgi:hypothetical protein
MPLIRPGGFYIIEDWPWKDSVLTPKADRDADAGLIPLIGDVLQSMAYHGSKSESQVSRLLTWPGFVAIERSGNPAQADWLSGARTMPALGLGLRLRRMVQDVRRLARGSRAPAV